MLVSTMLRNPASRHLLNPRQTLSVSHELSSWFSPASTSKQAIHTSATAHETARRRISRLKKRDQRDKRFEKERLALQNKPHPALGYSPGNEELWTKSKLNRVILTREMLDQLPVPKHTVQMEEERVVAWGEDGNTVFEVETADNKTHETGKLVPKLVNGRPVLTSMRLPKFFNFGVDRREKRLLFDDLGFLRKVGKEFGHAAPAQESNWSDGDAPIQKVKKTTTEEDIAYEKSLEYWLGRVLDLKNSNAAGLAFENKRRIIITFSEGQTSDTGRIEIQAALLTHRIHNLWEHIQKFKRDIHNRRHLLELIHARAKMLKYLRRTSRARYEAVLPQLGLERGAIEGEIIVTREMFRTSRVTA